MAINLQAPLPTDGNITVLVTSSDTSESQNPSIDMGESKKGATATVDSDDE